MVRDGGNLQTVVHSERESELGALWFNVCVSGRLTMFLKSERKQRKIKFGERKENAIAFIQ